MKKTIEIIRPRNLPALFLILGVSAFAGCASQKTAATRSNPTPGKTAAAVQTPENKTELSRADSHEAYDSEMPEIYEPSAQSVSKAVTKANFDQIKIGMSYREAVKILGEEGIQTSTMKVHNRETTIFKWTVWDFSKYIDLHFENDKVIEKKQKGLM